MGDPWRLAGIDDRRLAIHRLDDRRWWRQDAQPALAPILAASDVAALLAYEPPPPGDEADRVEHELVVNAAGMFRVGATAADQGLRIVFSSSADVYGRWCADPVREVDAPEPATPYSIAKLAAERLLAAVAAPREVLALRLGTVFGPGENGPRAIPSFARALLSGERPQVDGDGTAVRDYIHVEDVAAAILNACLLEEPVGSVLNVGSGRGRTTLEVLDAVRAAVDDTTARAVHVPSDMAPARLVLDITRAREVLGLDPGSDFDGLVRQEVDWLRARLANTSDPR